MSSTDVDLSGVFDTIEAESTAHDPVDQNEVSDAAVAEGGEAEDQGEATEQKQTEDKKDESQTEETGQTEEGQTQTTEGAEDSKTNTESESSEEQTDETSKTENKTDADYTDWKKQLPPPPPDYEGKKPEFNDEGQIVNMTPQEYLDYVKAEAVVANRKDSYANLVENRAFDIAEQILPDIKTNTAVRQLVENTRTASILRGQEIDTVQAAIAVRDALGLSSQKIEQAKQEGFTEGDQNAKVKIEESKNAALETGSSQRRSDNKPDKTAELQKRIARGDDNAFAELIGDWMEQGKI